MAEPHLIAEYVDRLASELAFDPVLSQRVRREAEDHLWEDVSADPAGGGPEAERRAVEKFGDPDAMAAQFAVVSLARQARGVGVATIVGIAAVFVAMKARLTWYVVTEYATGQSGKLGEVVVTIDRYAFWLSLRLGGTRGSLDVVIPVGSMVIEIVCAAGLVRSIRGMAQRATATGRVARPG